jgi:predicted GNAT family N-acyltransferase
MDKKFIIESLEISEQQIKDGKVLDAQEHLNSLKAKYGLCDENSKAKKG